MENSGILLVDDEIAYHGIIRALLAATGLAVICVPGGEEAIAATSQSEFALILLDIEMPGIDGYHTAALIRTQGGWAANCPIIAFTSLHPEEGEAHFLRLGMNGHLPKPFGVEDVATIMRRWVGVDIAEQGDSTPGARLAMLLGEEEAGRMADRFHQAMRDAIVAVDQGEDMKGYGHRIGGLAGTLGFGMLSTAWLGLQDDGEKSWLIVRALTQEAIARHEKTRNA